ncbi:MAG: DNA replication and repair protein RecF [Magnetococcales bacterium]|nr:DNA replication and repair protein RecF [Magnetococcales bacterium]
MTARRAMLLEWLRIRDFRNIAGAELRFGAGLNLVVGANGQGKSNLLEAVGVLASGRSFRQATSAMMLRRGAERFLLAGGVSCGGIARRLDVLGEERRQEVRLDGKSMAAASSMERVLAAVTVTPETPLLVRGGPGERRNYLDWLSFFAHRRHGVEARDYQRALQARNRLLKQSAGDPRELTAWEAQLAVLGAGIAARRRETLARVWEVLPGYLALLDLPPERFSMTLTGPEPLAVEALRERLAASRERDRRLGATGVGPHRDDLLLRMEGQPLARFGSRGQQKRFALALKLAEGELLEGVLGEPPVMVLDDPASELDRDGMARLMALMARQGRQCFLSAREVGEIPWPEDRSRVVCSVAAGVFQVIMECESS